MASVQIVFATSPHPLALPDILMSEDDRAAKAARAKAMVYSVVLAVLFSSVKMDLLS